MKLYIPINSNDFNSVFTTLSVSPSCFYTKRNYSFRRSTKCLLYQSDNRILASSKPVFHTKEFDVDHGYPLLIEIEFDNHNLLQDLSCNWYSIPQTVFLTSGFKLIFRSAKERDEVFSKTLKSIETKYVQLAVKNTIVLDKSITEFSDHLPLVIDNSIELENLQQIFKAERIINRMWGATLGSAISSVDWVSPEWKEIRNIVRAINNSLSLYLNKITESNVVEREHLLVLISKLQTVTNEFQTVDQAIALATKGISASELSNFKNATILGINFYEILLDGILNIKNIQLPLPLLIERFRRSILAKYNSKFPANYVSKIQDVFNDLCDSIDKEIENASLGRTLSVNSVINYNVSLSNGFNLLLPQGLSDKERLYLLNILNFFIFQDEIFDVDTFFANRSEILKNLGIYLSKAVPDFDKSLERRFLIELLNSFKSLKSKLDLSYVDNEVMKVVGILFTSGRDFLKFVEMNDKEEISNTLITFSIWGSIYGAASIPKTYTDSITSNANSMTALMECYSSAIACFKEIRNDVYPCANTNVGMINHQSQVQEPSDVYNDSDSVITNSSVTLENNPFNKVGKSERAQRLLNLIYELGETKLTDVKARMKFKKIGEVEELILSELSHELIINNPKKGGKSVMRIEDLKFQ